MSITPEEMKRVKGMGFLLNRGTEQFSGRIITENGLLSADQMAKLSEAARRFGNGTMAFTSRLTVELPGIPFDKIEEFRAFVAQEGMVTGGTGARVRPIVSCKGTTCIYGLYDTQGLATELHKRFYEGYYDVVLPHKFKIGVGGCPNNCIKPDLNDLGIIGQRVPVITPDQCKGCAKCAVQRGCPMQAAAVKDGLVDIDRTVCNSCGRCARVCPFGAVNGAETAYKVCVGGRWGKKIRIGTPLPRLFSRDELFDLVEKAILLFKRDGKTGERFGEMIDRIGIEPASRLLLSDDLLREKDKILSLDTKGGASC